MNSLATPAQIKKAFKAKAKQFHPDKNSAPETTQWFQFINEAYRTLGDAGARADYDARFSLAAEEWSAGKRRSDPIACSICGRVTAQPRFVIYRHVISALVLTLRYVNQGVFCPDCGGKAAYRSSLKTYILGWWGIPWGPIYSVQAIVSNFLGGEQPPFNNFKLLALQSIYFADLGRFDLAQAVARDAVTFANKIPENLRLNDPQLTWLINGLPSMVGTSSLDGPGTHLKKHWGVGTKGFKIQLGGLVLFVSLIAAMFFLAGARNTMTAYKHVPPIESGASDPNLTGAAPVNQDRVTPRQADSQFNEPILPLPSTGRLRTLWRSNPKTVLAPLKIVTPAGTTSYYLKAVDWYTHVAKSVFFVRSGDTARVSLPIGTYELRYAAGESWYGEEYLFGPQSVYRKLDEPFRFYIDGDNIRGYTVELVKQINGNLGESTMQPSDF